MSRRYPDGSRGDGVFKWVVRVTSVLTLVFAVVQAIRLVGDGRERRRQIDELMLVQQMHVKRTDYAAAWATLEQALKAAEPGGLLAKLTGQLSAEARRVRVAQEDLAMMWAEDLRVGAGEKYSPIVDRITEVMTRGAASSTGVRKADLIAHAGWATVYKSLDGASIADLTPQYRAALAEEPANPYAHACLGHWIAWTDGPLDQALKEFDAAIAANRARPFVRRVQRAALKRAGQKADPALIALATELRKNSEPIEPSLRSDVDSAYYSSGCGLRDNTDGMRAILAAVPPADQVVTYRRLFYDHAGHSVDDSRDVPRNACLATLLEAAGQREDALQTWRRVRQALGTNSGNTLESRADASIRRLRGR